MSSVPSPALSPCYLDSSPESSPALGPVDSSPPSSPSLPSVSLSPPVSPGVAHPYAASTKAVKPPRLYEKRDVLISDNEDVFGASENDGVWDADLASATRSKRLWMNSPNATGRQQSSHSRVNSNASASSSATEIPRARRVASGPLLFGVTGVSQRSLSSDSRDELAAIDLSDDELPYHTVRYRRKSRTEREQDIWDREITKAIDTANGDIQLEHSGLISSGLSFIPPTIADLASLVILPQEPTDLSMQQPPFARSRPFTRATTVPARPGDLFCLGSDHLLAKSTSMNLKGNAPLSSSTPKAGEIRINLGNNTILRLPVELFWLNNLTVLNMRNNCLTNIPPQIGLLGTLRDLNISGNRLTYLPAEMLEMKLASLVIDRNPWHRPPPEASPSEAHSNEVTSSTIHHFAVPSLLECCLRVLLAPHETLSDGSARPVTRLEATYELPLQDLEHYPTGVIDTLRVCVPRAVAKPDPQIQASPSKRARRTSARSRVNSTRSDVFGPTSHTLGPPLGLSMDDDSDPEDNQDIPPGIGTCMSPIHPRHSRPVFVSPATERFAWVHTIAGQPVREEAGVPVKWRGCMRGCLKFLGKDPGEVDSAAHTDVVPEGEGEAHSSARRKMLSGEEEDHGDPGSDGELGVEAIDLQGGLDDDFD